MQAQLYLRTESERHDECRDRLVAALPPSTGPELLSLTEGVNLSSVLVKGAPGADLGTVLVNAVDSLDRDLWPTVYGWKLDAEAHEEHYRTADQAWKDFWAERAARQA